MNSNREPMVYRITLMHTYPDLNYKTKTRLQSVDKYSKNIFKNITKKDVENAIKSKHNKITTQLQSLYGKKKAQYLNNIYKFKFNLYTSLYRKQTKDLKKQLKFIETINIEQLV